MILINQSLMQIADNKGEKENNSSTCQLAYIAVKSSPVWRAAIYIATACMHYNYTHSKTINNLLSNKFCL